MFETKDVWVIDCSTGCSCCSDENFEKGFYTSEESVNTVVEKWRKGDGNPLSSHYARYGRYYIMKKSAEFLPDGRIIVDDRVYPSTYLENPNSL